MTTYSVGLHNRGTGTDAWVFDLPGCRIIANDAESALSLVPATVGEHLIWLKQHGENVDLSAPIDFSVVETVETTNDFCFKADLEAASAEDVETAIRRSNFAHADMIARAMLPEPLIEYRPPLSAVKIENFPDARTIREIFQHGSGSSGVARNVGDTPWTPPGGDQPDPDAVREATIARLRALSPSERAKLYKIPNQRTGIDGEWSTRKVLRRMINHERFHVKEIEQRLAWLLVGIPEVMPASRE